jgi:histidinol-phosphate phosphatase family protein
MQRKSAKQKRNRVAVFLDRDGTILRERGYLANPRNLKIYPGVFAALKSLKKAGAKLVLISNQSGVGRGYFPKSVVNRIHKELQRCLGMRKAKLDAIYFCPHLPSAGCSCRKPRPGMPHRAARDLGIDLKNSYVVGDQEKDLKLARHIGARGVLVLTGAGRLEGRKARNLAAKISTNIGTAVSWILKDLNHG